MARPKLGGDQKERSGGGASDRATARPSHLTQGEGVQQCHRAVQRPHIRQSLPILGEGKSQWSRTFLPGQGVAKETEELAGLVL